MQRNLVFYSYDFVTIYDGETVFDNQLERLTGSSLAADYLVTSSGNKILINLESDSSETRSGFEIQFAAGKFLLKVFFESELHSSY